MDTSNIVGIYNDEDVLVSSIKKVQEKGIKIKDVYSPYPIHDVISLLGYKTRIPKLALLYGVFAVLVTFAFLYWTSVVNYPLRFGGKPQNTLSFIIVIFVMTINITAALTIVTFFVGEKKGPGKMADVVHPDLTDDKYAIVIDKAAIETEEDIKNISSVLKDSGAIEVYQKEDTN